MLSRELLLVAVAEEVADHLLTAEARALSYTRAYVDAVLSPRCSVPQPALHGLHPEVAKMCREIVLDAVALERRGRAVA